MSAFIVNDKTLNRILTFIDGWNFHGNTKLKAKFWNLKEYEPDETQEQVLNHIGLLLKELNAEAVSQRYEEKHEQQEFFYSPEKCNIFQAYNHIRCLTYQMSEGDVPETDLYKLLEEIERTFEEEIACEHPKVKSAEWEAKEKTKCFSVDSKDLFDKKKNPKLKLDVKSVLKNKKIKKKKL